MWLWIAATLCAFFVKGLCGFANTLVFTSIMGFGANNVNISPVELLLAFPSNIIQVWKNRKTLDPKVFIPLGCLVLLGCIPGAFLLKNVNAQYLKAFFGAVVIYVGLDMFLGEGRSTKENKVVTLAVGLISGVLCGLFGIGALMAAYISRLTGTGNKFKANASAVFLFENVFRIILYTVIGVITPQAIKQALILVPVMLFGMFLGAKSSDYLDDQVIRKIVIILLIISGAVLIIKSL